MCERIRQILICLVSQFSLRNRYKESQWEFTEGEFSLGCMECCQSAIATIILGSCPMLPLQNLSDV